MKPEEAIELLQRFADQPLPGDERFAAALETEVIHRALADAAAAMRHASEHNLNAETQVWRERAVLLRELSKRAAVLRGLVCEALAGEREAA
jgi:hypothetical protein